MKLFEFFAIGDLADSARSGTYVTGPDLFALSRAPVPV